jgi:hypothetical protein
MPEGAIAGVLSQHEAVARRRGLFPALLTNPWVP